MAAPVSRYGFRFGLVYCALVVVAGVAVGAAAVIVDRPAPTPPPEWSNWKPSGKSDIDRVRSIAAHVSQQYRDGSGGSQLVSVRGGPLSFSGQDTVLARRVDDTTTRVEVMDGETVQYRLCGPKENCGFRNSTNQAAAGVLAKREALELALYTFRYAPSVDNVVVLMPPLMSETASRALLLTRKDPELAYRLTTPLHRQLPGASTVKPTTRDAESIAIVADPYLYHFEPARLQDPSGQPQPAIVVNPIGLSAPSLAKTAADAGGG